MNGVPEAIRVYSVGPNGRGTITGRREQAPEQFTKQQREIDHQMRCRKNGCVRCG